MTANDTTRRAARPAMWRRILVASLGSLVAGLVLVWPVTWLVGAAFFPGDRSLVATLGLAVLGLVGAISPIFASTWLWHRMWQPGWPLGIVLMFAGSWIAGVVHPYL